MERRKAMENYESLEMEIIRFDNEDVITSSDIEMPEKE